MGDNYLTVNERKDMLYKEFKFIDKNGDGSITKKELFYYLDQKNNGKQFDRNLANQLFNQMEKDLDEKISVNEFINIWKEANDKLNEKIRETKTGLQVARDKKQKLGKVIQEYEQEEIKKAPSSVLHVFIEELMEVDVDQSIVVVSCKNERFETDQLYGSNPKPITQFDFNAVQLQDNLKIQLVGVNNPAIHHLEISVPVQYLSDQKIHEEWLNLLDVRGMQTNTRVKTELQWMGSKVKYFKEMDQNWDNHINKLETDLKQYSNDKRLLNRPDNFIQRIAHSDFYIDRLKPTHNPQFNAPTAKEKFEKIPGLAMHPFRYCAFYYLLFFFIFLMCFMVYRCVFFDLMITGIAIGCVYFDNPHFTTGNLISLIAGYGIQYLFDLIWLLKYPSNWWSSAYIDDGSLLNHRKVEIILSFILLALRAIAVMILCICLNLAKWKPLGKMRGNNEFEMRQKKYKPKTEFKHSYMFKDGYEIMGDDRLFLEADVLAN